jgi:hypothetical protein
MTEDKYPPRSKLIFDPISIAGIPDMERRNR